MTALRHERRPAKNDVQGDLPDIKARPAMREHRHAGTYRDDTQQCSRSDELDRRSQRIDRRLELTADWGQASVESEHRGVQGAGRKWAEVRSGPIQLRAPKEHAII